MGQRRRARECALQMLYQVDQTGSSAREVFETFWSDGQVAAEQRSFAECLVEGVLARCSELDALISDCARNWRLERMAIVDRNVLRMAVWELLHGTEVPPAVVIDEAIEISRRYGGEGSATFVNGVLDAIRKQTGR